MTKKMLRASDSVHFCIDEISIMNIESDTSDDETEDEKCCFEQI